MNIVQAKGLGVVQLDGVRKNIRALRALSKDMREKGVYRGHYARIINLLLAYFRSKPYHKVEGIVHKHSRPYVQQLQLNYLHHLTGIAKDGMPVGVVFDTTAFDAATWPTATQRREWLWDDKVMVVSQPFGSAKARKLRRKEPSYVAERAAKNEQKRREWQAKTAGKLFKFVEVASLYLAMAKVRTEMNGQSTAGMKPVLGVLLQNPDGSGQVAGTLEADEFLNDLRQLVRSLHKGEEDGEQLSPIRYLRTAQRGRTENSFSVSVLYTSPC